MSALRSTLFAVGLIAVLVIGGAGCASSGKVVSGDAMQRTLVSHFAPLYAPAMVGQATCPARTAAKVGAKSQCQMLVGSAKVAVDVTVTSAQGTIRFRPTLPVVIVAQVERDLAAQLHAVYDEPHDKVVVAVTCPGPRVRVQAQASAFRCSVSANGARTSEEVTIVDAAGNVTYRALQ